MLLILVTNYIRFQFSYVLTINLNYKKTVKCKHILYKNYIYTYVSNIESKQLKKEIN